MKYVIFDTETGGLDPATDALISLGACVWDSEKGRLPEPEFHSLVNDHPGRLDPGALKVNGFTEAHIRESGLGPALVWQEFVRFCQGVFGRDQVLLGGHNTGFDVGYLKRLARITGNAARYEAIFSHRTVCTMNTVRYLCLAGRLRAGMGGLLQVVEELGIEKQAAHHALGDARMAADLLTRLVDLVKMPEAA